MVVLRAEFHLSHISTYFKSISAICVPLTIKIGGLKFLVKANTEDPWLSSQNTYGVAINLCFPSRLEGV